MGTKGETMTLREKIEVMEAFERGEEIESKPRGLKPNYWKQDTSPLWDWFTTVYRIKPYEPVYEYQYAFEYKEGAYINLLYYTDTEALRFTEICQRIDFTKRERK